MDEVQGRLGSIAVFLSFLGIPRYKTHIVFLFCFSIVLIYIKCSWLKLTGASAFHQILHRLIHQSKFLLPDNIMPIRVSSGSHVLIEWTIPECTNLHGFLLRCFLFHPFVVGWGLGAYRRLGRRGVLQYQVSGFLTVQAWRMVDGVEVLVWTMHLEETQGGKERSG